MAAGSRLGAYVSGALLVRLADEGARVGLLLLAIERTGSPGLGGLLVAALLIPHVVAAPMVGLLTDRARRPQLVIAGAAAGFGLAFAAAAVTLGSISSILVAALLVAGGCCGPALTGALTSQLAALVPESRLPRAFGIDSLVYNVAGIGGPALAAVLATITSALSATLILAGAAVLGGVIIAVLPIKARAASISRLSKRDLNGGIAAILRQPVLATVTAATTAGQLGAGGLAVIAALLAAEQNNPAAVGWLLTSMAAGALIGSLLWTWRPAAVDRAPSVVMIMLIATGLPLVALAWSPSTVFAAVLFGVSGFFNGPMFGALLTVRNNFAPEDQKSQVFTLSAGAKLTANAVGSALAGAAAGLPIAVLAPVAAATAIIAGAIGQLVLRRRAR